MATFNERLMELMNERNWKQIDLTNAAKLKGIELKKGSTSRWFNQKDVIPTSETVITLADILGVNSDWLAGKDAPRNTVLSVEEIISPERKELLDIVANASEDKIKMLLHFARQFK